MKKLLLVLILLGTEQLAKAMPITPSQACENSCFSQYNKNNPILMQCLTGCETQL